jgi:cell division protein FtsA
MADDIITGLDIGSSVIRLAICKSSLDEEGKPHVQLMGAIASPSSGIHRGAISSMEDAVSSISRALERAERMTGVQINSAWVALSGQNSAIQASRGAIAVARPEAEITEDDVERVVEAAKTVAIPANYEILHVIPKSFSVDGQRGIKDPVGMSGIRLEVDAMIVEALSSHVKNLTKSIYRTGLDIDEVVFGPLATAEAILTQRQKELGVCMVNIGAATTSLAVFEEGDLLHTAVLPLGGDHVTNDIAIGLRTSIEIAERVKMAYGHAVPDVIDRKQAISLAEFGVEGAEEVKRRFIAEIIEARMEELFELVDAELRKIDRSGMLPVGAICAGGGMKLEGALEVGKRVLRLPCALGAPVQVTSVLDELYDPAFATAIGLAQWGHGIKTLSQRGFSFGNLFRFKSADKVAQKMRDWMKTFLP